MTAEVSSDGRTPLVIGVGNEFRGDDAAGLLVSREIRRSVKGGVQVVETPGGVSELLELWDGRDRVYLVDAFQSGGAPGTWKRLLVGREPLPTTTSGTSTHGATVASAIALGQVLDRMPKLLVIYGIEAGHFEPGRDTSEEVLMGVREVARALGQELELPNRKTEREGG